MNVIGTILRIISLAQITAETLNRLRSANEINADVKRLDKLHRWSCEFQANFHSIQLKFALRRSTLSKEKCKLAKMQAYLVLKHIEDLNSALNSRTTAVPPSCSSKPRILRGREQKRVPKQHSPSAQITGRLEAVESSLEKAIGITSHITCLIDLQEIEEKPNSIEHGVSSSKADVFYKYFDRPEIPQHVVMDYTTCGQNGEPVVADGRLV